MAGEASTFVGIDVSRIQLDVALHPSAALKSVSHDDPRDQDPGWGQMVSGMISQDFSATALFLNAYTSRLFPV